MTLTAAPSPSKNTKPSFWGHGERNRRSRRSRVRRRQPKWRARHDDGVGWQMVERAGELSRCRPKANTRSRRTRPRRAGSATGKARARTEDFEVDTEPPVVTLKAARRAVEQHESVVRGHGERKHAKSWCTCSKAQPKSRARKRRRREGNGRRAGVSKAPPEEGSNTFTANATEKSGLGNGEGKSGEGELRSQHEAAGREIDGKPPTPSNNTNPSFSGTASEATKSSCTCH